MKVQFPIILMSFKINDRISLFLHLQSFEDRSAVFSSLHKHCQQLVIPFHVLSERKIILFYKTYLLFRDDLIIEFVGEIVNHKEYRHRIKQYAKEKKVHSYFMAFKTDEILDATIRGNTSRFINHSCDPNCETQKVMFCIKISLNLI